MNRTNIMKETSARFFRGDDKDSDKKCNDEAIMDRQQIYSARNTNRVYSCSLSTFVSNDDENYATIKTRAYFRLQPRHDKTCQFDRNDASVSWRLITHSAINFALLLYIILDTDYRKKFNKRHISANSRKSMKYMRMWTIKFAKIRNSFKILKHF